MTSKTHTLKGANSKQGLVLGFAASALLHLAAAASFWGFSQAQLGSDSQKAQFSQAPLTMAMFETPVKSQPKPKPVKKKKIVKPKPEAKPEKKSEPEPKPQPPEKVFDIAPSQDKGRAQSTVVMNNPVYVSKAAPRYPRRARLRGQQGTVYLLLDVDAEGHVITVIVQKSSGVGALDRAAVKAAKKWRIQPAKRAGIAVASKVRVPVQFNLK